MLRGVEHFRRRRCRVVTNGNTVSLAGWGRYPKIQTRVDRPARDLAVTHALDAPGSVIARGLGRSYGDASLNPEHVVATDRLDRLLDFNPETGFLACEGGVTLATIIDTFVPRGWFVPVTPGTKFVTVGGMIAADVHGKNHHVAGTFADHIAWIDLVLPGHGALRCTPDENSDLFWATCGGMGLTGVIVRAAFRMMPIASSSVMQTTQRCPNLSAALDALDATLGHPYSVAWIDCQAGGASLGRSVLFTGRHAVPDELSAQGNPLALTPRRRLTMPVDAPAVLLNRWSIGAFNAFYYRRAVDGEVPVDLERYFYPLDAIGGWNRIYGRRGFVQHQSGLPLDGARESLKDLLQAISTAGSGSFLAVLKRMGPASSGWLSFPFEGYSLALDFPANPRNLALLDRLDVIVNAARGRLYLAKDARMSIETFDRGYPQADKVRALRRKLGLDVTLRSGLSERLKL